jgi:serine/threonine protein kinase
MFHLKLSIIIYLTIPFRGYSAPEKVQRLVASMKSDVFSFGIIVIEIITGTKHLPSGDVPEWVSNKSNHGIW